MSGSISENVPEHQPSAITLGDCAIELEVPAHIARVSDLQLRQRAGDVWSAATTVLRAIDLFRQWILELERSGDAHPAVPRRLRERIDVAIHCLCRSGIQVNEFRPECERALMASFPGPVHSVTSFNPLGYPFSEELPLGPFAPWQIRYRAEYREKTQMWWNLEGRLRTVIELLRFPSTAFAEVTLPDSSPFPRTIKPVNVSGKFVEGPNNFTSPCGTTMTIEQIAAVVSFFYDSRITARTLRAHNVLGSPIVDSKGGPGKKKRWTYHVEKPRLEERYGISLPELAGALEILSNLR